MVLLVASRTFCTAIPTYVDAATAIYTLGSINGVPPIDWITFMPGITLEQRSEVVKSGFQAGLYIINGKPVLAFAPTNLMNLADDITDLQNYFGRPTTQYGFAVELANAVRERYPDVVLTGFSLGGGLAAFAGATNSIHAITFDPAPVPPGTPPSDQVLNLEVAGGAVEFGKAHVGTTLSFSQDIFLTQANTASANINARISLNADSTPAVVISTPNSINLFDWHSMSWFKQLTQTNNYQFYSQYGNTITVSTSQP